MRIDMVSEHASPLATLGGVDAGGQNVHVAALATALAQRGHSVRVFTRRDAADLPERVPLSRGVEVVHVDAGPAHPIPKDDLLPWMDDFGDRLAEFWTASPPDVVHSHFWMSGLAALRGSADGATWPVLHTFHALGNVKRRHQGSDDTSPPERAALEPGVGRRADGVIATCSDEAFELTRLGIPTARISVVPCGVDTALFTPRGRVAPATGRRRILSVGRLVPRKGVGTTITAIAELVRRGHSDIELVVVGGSRTADRIAEDPDVQRLAALARTLGIEDSVSFRGQVPHSELPPILRSAEAIVCAPWYEPFGIVPLEAMATGVPVVAAAVGGLIDTVVDGVTGLHVPPRDATAIADALETLLGDAELRASLGAAGVARAARRYTWTRVATDTERVYRRVAAGLPASTARARRASRG